MFDQKTQTTIGEAKRRIEAMTPQMTFSVKGPNVDSAEVVKAINAELGGATASFTPEGPGTYRVKATSTPGPHDVVVGPTAVAHGALDPPWSRYLKAKQRKKLRKSLARMANGTAFGRDEDRIIRLEAKAHKRAKKRNKQRGKST